MRGSRLFKVNVRFVGPGRWRWNVLIRDGYQQIDSGIARTQRDCRAPSLRAQKEYIARHPGQRMTIR